MSKQLLNPTLLALVFHIVFVGSSDASETPKQTSSLQDFSMLGIKAGDDFESVLGNPVVMSGEQRDADFGKEVPPFVLPPDLLEMARNFQGSLIPNEINLVYLDQSTAPKLLGAPVYTFKIKGRVDPAENRLKVVAIQCSIVNVDQVSFIAAVQEQFGYQGFGLRDGNGNVLGALEAPFRAADGTINDSPGVVINFRADNLAKDLDTNLETYIKNHHAEKEKKSREALPQPSGTLQ